MPDGARHLRAKPRDWKQLRGCFPICSGTSGGDAWPASGARRAWSGRLAKGNTAQQWVKLEMLSGSGSFLLDGFGSFAACFFVGLHEIDVTYAQCRGEFKQGNHSWIAAPALEIADVLLGKARCIRELFLREALLLPQPPEISADQLAHVHSSKLRLYIL